MYFSSTFKLCLINTRKKLFRSNRQQKKYENDENYNLDNTESMLDYKAEDFPSIFLSISV